MNIGLPDIKGMSDREFILWVCGAILVYLLLMNPMAISHKLDAMGELQAQMVKEHSDLLMLGRVECVNRAELIQEKETRARHLNRCLTLQVGEIKG